MASFSFTQPLTVTYTSKTVFGTPSLFPNIKNRKKGSIVRVSCKGSESDKESSNPSLDRRNVLIGLGGLYGTVSGVGSDPFAFANPVAPPDLTKCEKAEITAGGTQVECCPPLSTKIVDFKPSSTTKLRVRRPAHTLDDASIAKYNEAMKRMRALKDDDPRSFKAQADVHCAYCNGAYGQVGFKDVDLQVHFSWLFFPFHRWYLYFYEKILGSLIDDPTFALPYWNWDSPSGMQMPAIFTDPNSALYDSLRNTTHQPPTIVDLNWSKSSTSTLTDEQLIESNLKIMYRQMVSAAKVPLLFFGDPFRAGDSPRSQNNGAGTIENTPHTQIHLWSGNEDQTNGEDMGNFYSAGRDPMFYSHHSNVDRMWTVWKSQGGKSKDLTDPDYLNAQFLFYDEKKQLVQVKVRDCFDTKNLGYKYDKEDIREMPWYKSKPQLRKPKESFRKKLVENTIETTTPLSSFPLVLDKTITVLVPRPKKSRSKKEKKDAEEVLLVDGIEFKTGLAVKFDVYLDDDDQDDSSGPDKAEFAGSFVNVPHNTKGSAEKQKKKTCLKLGISDLLDDVGADDDDNVLVTLVPKTEIGKVTIGGIKIDFLS
ncbi:hypothetical protein UlMin_017167 [Ulmus minor]